MQLCRNTAISFTSPSVCPCSWCYSHICCLLFSFKIECFEDYDNYIFLFLLVIILLVLFPLPTWAFFFCSYPPVFVLPSPCLNFLLPPFILIKLKDCLVCEDSKCAPAKKSRGEKQCFKRKITQYSILKYICYLETERRERWYAVWYPGQPQSQNRIQGIRTI